MLITCIDWLPTVLCSCCPFDLVWVLFGANHRPICCVWITDKESGHHVPLVWTKKRNPDVRCSLSHCWTISLFSGFGLFSQHVGFFDTTSDKTKQTNKSSRNDTAQRTSKLAGVWTSVKWINELVAGWGVLFCVVCFPSCDKTREVFVSNQATTVNDTLSDGRAAKAYPLIWQPRLARWLRSSFNVKLHQYLSSHFNVYVTLSISCLCDQRPAAEALSPLSKHNQLRGNS